ncbi:adenosylmethionine decarboxylase [Effusibacillus consociatus]|uniref:Polyamine aminopropyltransferase n=1 Tax=Effusibacillus consociatus TaxID=1117041 RepID=A0ABV9Q0D1_9BACL
MVGEQVVIDAFGCDSALLNDADLLERILTNLLQDLGMEILHTHFHRFHPQGVTGAIIISTSHLAIHTWPEHKYAALDLFTCGDMASWEQIEDLLRQLSAERAVVYQLARGDAAGAPPSVREIHLHSHSSVWRTKQQYPHRPVHGDARDVTELRQLLSGRHRIVYQAISENREVLLVEAFDLRMYLNQQLQFSALDERIYHEALVHPVLSLARERDRVLIIGGGDGLALREVLKYPDVSRVHLVDLDPMILNAAANVPEMVALNEGAFSDRRVRVFQQDAQFFLTRRRRRYNVIILDLPDPADAVLSRLYTKEFFETLSNHLAPDGILVCQSHSPQNAPFVFWSIAETLESAGLPTLSYHVNVPSFGDWGFHLAGHTRPIKRLIQVSIPNRTLPKDLSSWFHFDDAVLSVRKNVEANTLDQLTLHKFYQKAVGPKFD